MKFHPATLARTLCRLALALCAAAPAAYAQDAPATPPAVSAQTSLAREAAMEMVTAYRQTRGEGMLQAEERCWREARASTKRPAPAALGCARLMIAAGIVDQALQITEGRGPTPAFAPDVQRRRFLERTTLMGLNQQAAQSILERAVAEIPAMVEGLSLAGVR